MTEKLVKSIVGLFGGLATIPFGKELFSQLFFKLFYSKNPL